MVDFPNFSRKWKAIVYPAGTIAGYGHIQSLGLAHIPVVATHLAPCDSFLSRYVIETHVVPDPVKDHAAFVQWLVEYGSRQDAKPVLFMAEDVFAYIVSLYQAELSPTCLYPYIPLEKLDRFFNKELMFEYAAKAEVPIPRTLTRPTHERLLEWDTFPAVIKPLVARFAFRGRELVSTCSFPTRFGSKAVRVDTREELLEAVSRAEEYGIACFVQEYLQVANRELPTIKFVAGRDHSLPAVFIGRKTRQWPADFGTCTVGEAEYMTEVFDLTARFIKTIEYVGGGGIEFIWNEKERQWQFVEMNARLDFWIGMAALKGVNLPLQQYLLSTGQPMFTARQRDGGRFWIDVIGDWEDRKWRKGRPEWRISFWERIRPYLYFNEAVFSWRDPVPGARRLARPMVRRMLQPLRTASAALQYVFRSAPHESLPDYETYWKRRKEDGTSHASYPRFETAASLIRPTESVLDYGCGSGEFLMYLRDRGYRDLVGSDVCRPDEFPNDVPFRSESELENGVHFDVVTMLQVAEHIANAEDVIARMLDMSDRVIVSIPNCGYWQHRLRLLCGRVPVTDVLYDMSEHVRLWTHKDFTDVCRQRGWAVRDVRATVPHRGTLAALLPGLFAKQLVYVLQKAAD